MEEIQAGIEIKRAVEEWMYGLCMIAQFTPGIINAMVPYTVDVKNPYKSGLPNELCTQIERMFEDRNDVRHPCIQALIHPDGVWPNGYGEGERRHPDIFITDVADNLWKLFVLFSCISGPYKRTWTVWGVCNPSIVLGGGKPLIHFEF